MENLKTKFLIGIIATCFLFIGCAAVPPKPVGDLGKDLSKLQRAVDNLNDAIEKKREAEKPATPKDLSPNAKRSSNSFGFFYEGNFDVDVLMSEAWGEPAWVSRDYLPHWIEMYYKNPDPTGAPQWACIVFARGGIMGYSYITDGAITFLAYNPVSKTFVINRDMTGEQIKKNLDDYDKAINRYQKKGI